MERLTFRLKLNKDKKKDYIKRHNPIWPDLEKKFLENGVEEYSIFIDDDTNELFGVINVKSKAHWDKISNSNVVSKWRKYMESFYEKDENNFPKLTRLREVFHIKK